MAYKPYEESEELKKAQQALLSQLGQKPEDYRSSWASALQKAMEGLLNREDFRYDPGSDPLYQNYREEYIQDGRLAMEDTLGKSQAMTGGYGNSYAQTAAQQTYGGYLQDLNSRIPELYDLALSQYQLKGQAMEDQLDLLQAQEDRDYSRWEDTLQQWQAQRDFLASQADSLRDQDYARWESDRDYAWQQEQADREQQRWQAEFDEAVRQFETAQAAKTASKGGSGGSYSGNGGVDADTVRKAQEFVGTAVDGMWGKNSKAAAKAKGYNSLQEVIAAMEGKYQVSDGVAAVKSLAAAGTDQRQLSAYIAKLTVQGLLTSDQAADLRKAYVAPKYYY